MALIKGVMTVQSSTETMHSFSLEPNQIPQKFVTGLDPEWILLWNEHGSKVTPASQVTIEEYRQCPEKYSFMYPTWRGE